MMIGGIEKMESEYERIERSCVEFFGWDFEKDVNTFFSLVRNLSDEGKYSRSSVVECLIMRVIALESKIKELEINNESI